MRFSIFLAVIAITSITGCASSILPKPVSPPITYSLATIAPQEVTLAKPAPQKSPTLIVGSPRAAGGFNTSYIVYTRKLHEVAYFSQSQWVDTPSQMLMPMIADAIQKSGAFKAVLSTPTGALSQFRLDTELVQLQHSFLTNPSQVHLTLRAVLIDTATRNVVARNEFHAAVPTSTEDAYGGVIAAQKAVQTVLKDLASFCADSVAR